MSQRRLPVTLVGRMKNGTTAMPVRASTQLHWNSATMETTTVAMFLMEFVIVEETTLWTPFTSPVMRVMISPCLLSTKYWYGCRWNCSYICVFMS